MAVTDWILTLALLTTLGDEATAARNHDEATSQGLRSAARNAPLRLENGWFVHGSRVIWGYAQHNGWWGGCRKGNGFWTTYKVRANITRRAPGRIGPALTEDLERLTDNMLRYGYPGFEHNFGLWYDRRRDAHDTTRRPDARVVPPFLEQPWARSDTGTAWDGLPRYDLTQYNPWYFQRLQTFAQLCGRKGLLLLFHFYMQHALLETEAHYVDFPWRPANCLQDTGLPDHLPAANAFYDVTHPTRRDLHRAYIRHCLDQLGGYDHVVYLIGEEYTGPLAFMQFWLDTVTEWERETGKDVLVAVSATHDVREAILADPVRGPAVSVLDLRYSWRREDGSLFAPAGGEEVPGRYAAGFQAAQESPPAQLYRQVRAYRRRYPQRALLHSLEASRQQTWAFLMAGGSLLIRRMEYPDQAGPEPWQPPADYIAPEHSAIIQPTYDFIRTHLAERLPKMVPLEGVLSRPERNWCLAEPPQTYLVYALEGGELRLDLSATAGQYHARWFDPRTGALHPAADEPVEAGKAVTFHTPDDQDWVLWLDRIDQGP